MKYNLVEKLTGKEVVASVKSDSWFGEVSLIDGTKKNLLYKASSIEQVYNMDLSLDSELVKNFLYDLEFFASHGRVQLDSDGSGFNFTYTPKRILLGYRVKEILEKFQDYQNYLQDISCKTAVWKFQPAYIELEEDEIKCN